MNSAARSDNWSTQHQGPETTEPNIAVSSTGLRWWSNTDRQALCLAIICNHCHQSENSPEQFELFIFIGHFIPIGHGIGNRAGCDRKPGSRVDCSTRGDHSTAGGTRSVVPRLIYSILIYSILIHTIRAHCIGIIVTAISVSVKPIRTAVNHTGLTAASSSHITGVVSPRCHPGCATAPRGGITTLAFSMTPLAEGRCIIG
jgi:hypothetical protein